MYKRRRYGKGIYGSSKHRVGYNSGKQAIGQAGMRFIEANMNPFGSDTIGPKSFRAVIPDGNGSVSAPVCLTCSVSVPASANNIYGIAAINLGGYTASGSTVVGQAISISTGATSALGTTVLSGGWNEDTLYVASVGTHKKFRIVGAGIRCYPISNSDNTQGLIRAALSPYVPVSVTATSDTTSTAVAISTTFSPFVIEESYPLVGQKAGICCRRPYQCVDHEYSDVPQYHGCTGTTTTGTINRATVCGNMPMLYWESLSDTTALRIDAVLHLEVQVSSTQYPGLLANSPAEIGIASIYAFINSHENVVPGQGFRSWVRRK